MLTFYNAFTTFIFWEERRGSSHIRSLVPAHLIIHPCLPAALEKTKYDDADIHWWVRGWAQADWLMVKLKCCLKSTANVLWIPGSNDGPVPNLLLRGAQS